MSSAITQTEGYNISITGRHLDITEGMRQHAIDKISKIERFHPRNVDVHVILDIQKVEHHANLIIRFNDFKVKVSASSNDMYVSIDQAVAKLEQQLRKYKNKIEAHNAKGSHRSEVEVEVVQPSMLEEVNDAIDEENRKALHEALAPHQVVAREKKVLKTLTLDEAIMKMELSNNVFLAYRNEADNKLKIIYRREDENYGIIDLS